MLEHIWRDEYVPLQLQPETLQQGFKKRLCLLDEYLTVIMWKKSPVCTTIIVFSAQLLLCQTNDFLPFVHKSCAGFACRKLEREKAAVFRFSPFSPDYRNLLWVCSAMNAFPEPQTISPENSCVEKLWFSMCLCVLACSPTPSPFSANGTVHLKRRLSSLNALCPFNSQLRGAHFTGAVLAL